MLHDMSIKKTSIVLIIGMFLLLMSACSTEESSQANTLTFISRTSINVPEASGLAVYNSEMYLTVSDSVSKVYLIDLEGHLIRSLPFSGKNLEGVAYDRQNAVIYVVEEKDNTIVKLDTLGLELARFNVPLENDNPRHGLEGITFNPENGHLFVISEKDPSLLFEIQTDGTILKTHELDFAKDYSSVYFDPQEKQLWILSDDSRTLTKTTLSGEPLITYNTGIDKGEGVIVDPENSRVYIITDTSSSFYTLSF